MYFWLKHRKFHFFWVSQPERLMLKIVLLLVGWDAQEAFLEWRKIDKKHEKTDFYSFFIIERVFFKGIHRKNKKVKTLFASILIPKCVFSKTKIQNIINHRIQFIMKITIFRKLEKPCNTKTIWKQIQNFKVFVGFDQKYTYNTTLESLIKPVKINKNHGNDQFGGSFEHCVRCV